MLGVGVEVVSEDVIVTLELLKLVQLLLLLSTDADDSSDLCCNTVAMGVETSECISTATLYNGAILHCRMSMFVLSKESPASEIEEAGAPENA